MAVELAIGRALQWVESHSANEGNKHSTRIMGFPTEDDNHFGFVTATYVYIIYR